MPQVIPEDYKEYEDFLKSNNVKLSDKTIKVKDINPTQKNFNHKMVEIIKRKWKSLLKKRPVLISSDNYILDGHHRVLAIHEINPEQEIKVVKADVNIKKLLDLTAKFPKVQYRNINTFSESFESIKMEESIDEDAPENNSGTGNITTKSEPIKPHSKYANCDVFEIDGDTFNKCAYGRMKYERWKKTLGEGDLPTTIRKHIEKTKNKRIVLKNEENGSMIFFNTYNKRK